MPNEILDETANFPSVIYFQVYLKLDFKPVHEKAQVFLFNKELEPKVRQKTKQSHRKISTILMFTTNLLF